MALRVYVAGIAASAVLFGGWVLSGELGGPGVSFDLTLLVLTGAVVISELCPVYIVRRNSNEEFEVGHAFVLAILLLAGPAAAVMAQLAATTTSSLLLRRPPVKAVFNIGQKVLATAAAGAVFSAVSELPAMGQANGLTATEVAAFLLAAAVYQLVNELAVMAVCALAEQRKLLSFFRADLRLAAFSAAVSLNAPLAAAGAMVGAWLVPVMVAPLWVVRRSWQVALASFEQARRDALTGLPNARALRETLSETMPHNDVALIMLDLDGFKEINDTLGHQTGDDLLRAVARRFEEHAAAARFFRLQGDEFVAVMDGPGSAAALALADELVSAFQLPFAARDLEVEIGLSAGVAVAERRACDIDEVLRRADVAMYQAKRHRTGFALYTVRHDTADPARQVIAADLRRALVTDELEVHYQPQIALATGQVVSFEGLVRWRRADGTLMPPNQFIPAAEHTSLIMPLTLHVLGEALAQCCRWSADHGYEGRVGVNLSARTLHHRSLVADVRRALIDAGVAPERLELEITESALMVDPAGARRTLQALHELGVEILIDDFGTGYSSLAYLGTLPVDGVKIDRSFVGGLETEGNDAVIVRSTIDLGHNLGLRVVAEGVEDDATRARLLELDCDLAQGWLWSAALPPAEVGPAMLAPVPAPATS